MDKFPNHTESQQGKKVKPLDSKSFFRIRWASIAVVSAIITLSGWALSSPIGSSPDDDFHLPSIWCGQGFRDGICEQTNETDLVKVPVTTFANSGCFAFNNELSGKCSYDPTLQAHPRVNLLTDLYPPVYYWTMSWFAGADISVSTITMRLANSVFFVLALALIVIALPIHLRRVPLLTFLITSVPLGVFLIASTNPSGWTYFSLVFFFSLFTAFLTSEEIKSKWILGVLAAIFSVAASGARADASVFVVAAIALAFLTTFSRRVFSAINVGLSLLLVAIASYFYFSIASGLGVVSGSLGNSDSDPSTAPSFFVTMAGIPNLWVGVFGVSGIGWLDTPMPAIVWAITLGVFTSLMFFSVRWFSVKQGLAVGASLFLLTAVPLFILIQSGLEVGQQVQPRYLLPLIAFLAASALYRTSVESGMVLTRAQIFIVGIGLFVANGIALHLNTRRYTTGMDVMGVNLDEGIEWWWDGFPFSPNTVWLIATLGSGLLILSVWKLRNELGLPVDKSK